MLQKLLQQRLRVRNSSFTFTTIYFLLMSILASPSNALGINCRGSFFCLGMETSNITGKITDLLTHLPGIQPRAIYTTGAHIACLAAEEALSRHTGAFCLFMQNSQGNMMHEVINPVTGDIYRGIDGSLIKRKSIELLLHGCRACGSVPISDDNNPDEEGILTVNYVTDPGTCTGSRICPPTVAADDVHNPLNAGQAMPLAAPSRVVDPMANGSQPCSPGPQDPIVVDTLGVPLDDCDASVVASSRTRATNKAPASMTVNASGKEQVPSTAAASLNAASGGSVSATNLRMQATWSSTTPTTLISTSSATSPGTSVESGLPFAGGH